VATLCKEAEVTKVADRNLEHDTTGAVMHGAFFYDLMVWLMMFGRERAFREKILELARIETGESVLDIGCGTGTLAIAAKRRVGPAGSVSGIDPSPEMLARAGRKARKAGLDVVFRNATAQALPFPGGRFDVVLTSAVLHHLPRDARAECAREMRRVLKPGGRLLVVDFAEAGGMEKQSSHSRHHGHLSLDEMIAMLNEAGLNIVESGAMGFRNMQFALGTAPP
jgi:ubiquinone/menaquinone biosynthesis C-methylase UbiE